MRAIIPLHAIEPQYANRGFMHELGGLQTNGRGITREQPACDGAQLGVTHAQELLARGV
jgi:hypothetical protein